MAARLSITVVSLFLILSKSICLPLLGGTCELDEGSLEFSALAGAKGGWEFEGRARTDLEAVQIEPSLLWKWGSARGIIGYGALGRGMAFRKSPYARAPTSSDPPWSSDGSAQVVGFRVGGLSLVWKADSTVHMAGGDATGSPDGILARDPRLVVLELDSGREGALEFAAAVQFSRLPHPDPGQGWRPGSVDTLSQTLLGLSIASRYRVEEAGLGFWFSGLCGSLARPVAAASIQAGSGWMVLGRGKAVEGELSFFLYCAGEGFLDIEGNPPTWDRIQDMKIELRGGLWSLDLGLIDYSQNSDACCISDPRLPKPDASSLERLLWRWRSDILCSSFSARFGSLGATLKVKADSAGLAAASASAVAGLPPSGRSWMLNLVAGAKFGRPGVAEADDSGDEGPDEEAGLASGSGILSLKRIGAGVDLDSPDSAGFLRRFSASLGFFALKSEDGWEPVVELALQARITPAAGFQVSIRISTPSGGYSLARLPDTCPRISLAFRLGQDSP